LSLHIKALLVVFTSIFITQCATQQRVEAPKIPKLKKNERLYFGNVFVTFNEQKQARCDLFLNSSISAEFKVTLSGIVNFASSSKRPRLTEIACLFDAGKEKFWVYYPISVRSLKRVDSKEEITYFGDIDIHWTLTKEDIDHSEFNKAYASSQKISGKGEFKMNIKDEYQTAIEKFKSAYSELNSVTFSNQTFKLKEQE
jgi:hypothetical protein